MYNLLTTILHTFLELFATLIDLTTYTLHGLYAFFFSLTCIPSLSGYKTHSPHEENTYILITGCSSGIGEHVALDLATKGYRVFAGVRKQEDATRLSTRHANIIPVIIDVTEEKSVLRCYSHGTVMQYG